MHTIHLTAGPDGIWYATHSDPQVLALFGTATLPTPYGTTHTSAATLCAEIRRLNPTADVTTYEVTA